MIEGLYKNLEDNTLVYVIGLASEQQVIFKDKNNKIWLLEENRFNKLYKLYRQIQTATISIEEMAIMK